MIIQTSKAPDKEHLFVPENASQVTRICICAPLWTSDYDSDQGRVSNASVRGAPPAPSSKSYKRWTVVLTLAKPPA